MRHRMTLSPIFTTFHWMRDTLNDKSHTCTCLCIPLLLLLLVIKPPRDMQSSHQMNHSCFTRQLSSLLLLLLLLLKVHVCFFTINHWYISPSSFFSFLSLLFAFNLTALDTWSMVNVRSKSIDLFHLQENKITRFTWCAHLPLFLPPPLSTGSINLFYFSRTNDRTR